MNYALWVVQALLALIFLWAGGMKLVLPLEELKGQVPLPGLFLRSVSGLPYCSLGLPRLTNSNLQFINLELGLTVSEEVMETVMKSKKTRPEPQRESYRFPS